MIVDRLFFCGRGWGNAARESLGQRGFGLVGVYGLRASKRFRRGSTRRTESPFNVPSMALKGFVGRPVRQFLLADETVKNP